MRRYCCVPYCTSNGHGKKYVTVFRFPKNERMQELWMIKIRRNFQVKKDSVVCAKHFLKKDIIWSDTLTLKDGSTINCPRVVPKLVDSAYPCIFSEWPQYLNEPPQQQTVNDQVCERHFVDSDIVREASAIDPNTGRRITCKLGVSRLKKDAVPSVFPDYPSCFSKKDLREDPEKRRIRLENQQFQLALKHSLENQTEDGLEQQVNQDNNTETTVLNSNYGQTEEDTKEWQSKEENTAEKELETHEQTEEDTKEWQSKEKNTAENALETHEQRFREESSGNNALSTAKKLCRIPVITVPIKDEREAIFGNYIASEMRVLNANPVLYLQTKQAILEALTSSNFKLINPEAS